MTVTLTLPPETEKKLHERAARAGQSVEVFLRELVERAVSGENGTSAESVAEAVPTFDEMTAPFARAVEATGMSEEELGDFFRDVLAEVRAERKASQDKAE